MYRACIVSADATRARVFAFERHVDGDRTRETLVELADLVNPARRRRPSELFSDTRPGTNRNHRFAYAFDDHRDAHVDRMDAEFACGIADAATRALRDSGAIRLIMCASPHMLGALRAALPANAAVVVDALARDLAKLPAPELRATLADYGLLPPQPPRAGIASTMERRGA